MKASQERVQNGLKIQAVASSYTSADLARNGGIEILELNDTYRVDITVDGADQIDLKKRMIKGGGGAHVRGKNFSCRLGRNGCYCRRNKVGYNDWCWGTSRRNSFLRSPFNEEKT